MTCKAYLLAGQFRGGKEAQLGLSVFQLAEGGLLTHLETVRQAEPLGAICFDPDRALVYAVREKPAMVGRLGGGSCVYTFSLNYDDGSLTEQACTGTLAATPSYVCLDREKRHILVSHNGGAGRITRISRQPHGGYCAETLFDDGALVVLSLDPAGKPTEITDVYVPENAGEFGPRALINEGPGSPGGILANPGTAAHLHCVRVSPGGHTVVCCDFGQGKILSFCYDSQKGRLTLAAAAEEAVDTGVRYALFHPTLPVVYINCENAPLLFAYRYEEATGKLFRMGQYPIGAENTQCGTRDMVFSPRWGTLYLSGTDNRLYVLTVQEDGSVHPKAQIPCLGNAPRTLALSRDKGMLFCGCNRSDTIERFALGEDGVPGNGKIVAEGVSASAIQCVDISE